MQLTNIDEKLSTIELVPENVPQHLKPKEEQSEPMLDVHEAEPEPQEPEPQVPAEPEPEAVKTDDYGTPVDEPKERIYTESEVQQMIRDRLSRVKQEPAPQPQQETTLENDNWESQLESFVEQTLTKREQKMQKQHWQQEAAQQQAEFEIKFNKGASKYADFEQVVMGKPLTPQMVIATRGMNDPAAFIYAAAKTQANELDRISKIGDPMTQAVELGKLEERMKISKKNVSQAPKPIADVKGDYVEKTNNKPRNIDDLLRQEEKIRSRRR